MCSMKYLIEGFLLVFIRLLWLRKGFKPIHEVDSACSFLTNMTKYGCVLNLVFYRTLIHVCSKCVAGLRSIEAFGRNVSDELHT